MQLSHLIFSCEGVFQRNRLKICRNCPFTQKEGKKEGKEGNQMDTASILHSGLRQNTYILEKRDLECLL